MSERKYLTITALNRYLKYRFDNDDNLQNVLLKAEISNFKHHSRGHLYLTLKDDSSQISAVMFAGETKRLNFEPKDGDKVIIEGHVTVYEPYGTYQVYIHKMDLDGIGDLYLAYEKLKDELNRQGLFHEDHKKALPKYPRTVGVITSPTGAAVRDVINVISIRYPLANIIIYPALVQGVGAKESVADQINAANRDNLADVLIVGRGGGSIEDLWAFNEEIVARAIYASKIPIISAVGHETDFTIADFTSDVRASTPSHAAELAVPSKKDIIKLLETYKERLSGSLSVNLDFARKHLNRTLMATILHKPTRLTESIRMKLIYLEEKLNAYRPTRRIEQYLETIVNYRIRLDQRIEHLIGGSRIEFINISDKLELVNPLGIMKKGFTIAKQDGSIRKSINEVDTDSMLEVNFHDGSVDCKIIKKVVK